MQRIIDSTARRRPAKPPERGYCSHCERDDQIMEPESEGLTADILCTECLGDLAIRCDECHDWVLDRDEWEELCPACARRKPGYFIATEQGWR